MTDTPDNLESHTLVLLHEMRAETNQRFDRLENALSEVAGAVGALAKVSEKHTELLHKLHEGQGIIESDLRVVKMRVDRIERHMGLVKA